MLVSPFVFLLCLFVFSTEWRVEAARRPRFLWEPDTYVILIPPGKPVIKHYWLLGNRDSSQIIGRIVARGFATRDASLVKNFAPSRMSAKLSESFPWNA